MALARRHISQKVLHILGKTGSHVSGWVSVECMHAGVTLAYVVARVTELLASNGFQAIFLAGGKAGNKVWVAVATPDTVAQGGRGEHGYTGNGEFRLRGTYALAWQAGGLVLNPEGTALVLPTTLTQEPAQEQETTQEPAQEQETTQEPAQEQETTQEPVQEQETVVEALQALEAGLVEVFSAVVRDPEPEAAEARGRAARQRGRGRQRA